MAISSIMAFLIITLVLLLVAKLILLMIPISRKRKNQILASIGILAGIFLLSLILLEFMKSGSTCGYCPPPPYIYSWERECSGYRFSLPSCVGCLDAGNSVYCLGKKSDKICYTLINKSLTEVPDCKNPSTWQEILSICPSCIEEASVAAERMGKTEEFVNR